MDWFKNFDWYTEAMFKNETQINNMSNLYLSADSLIIAVTDYLLYKNVDINQWGDETLKNIVLYRTDHTLLQDTPIESVLDRINELTREQLEDFVLRKIDDDFQNNRQNLKNYPIFILFMGLINYENVNFVSYFDLTKIYYAHFPDEAILPLRSDMVEHIIEEERRILSLAEKIGNNRGIGTNIF